MAAAARLCNPDHFLPAPPHLWDGDGRKELRAPAGRSAVRGQIHPHSIRVLVRGFALKDPRAGKLAH